jgi:hypothetical protein
MGSTFAVGQCPRNPDGQPTSSLIFTGRCVPRWKPVLDGDGVGLLAPKSPNAVIVRC